MPHLSDAEAKKVARLQQQGRTAAANRIVEISEAREFNPGSEKAQKTINVTIEGGDDPERTADLAARRVKQAERLKDRHYGPTGGYRGT
jgi:hypothetical protein